MFPETICCFPARASGPFFWRNTPRGTPSDVYRGDMKAHRGFLEYMAAESFFPKFLAGPVLRASHVLPRLDVMPVPTWPNIRQGTARVIAGLPDKGEADLLDAAAAAAFDAIHPVGTLDAWTGALAFTAQIHRDSAAIPISPSAWRSSSALIFRAIFIGPILRRRPWISGGGGTSPCRAGCATLSVFHRKETAMGVGPATNAPYKSSTPAATDVRQKHWRLT